VIINRSVPFRFYFALTMNRTKGYPRGWYMASPIHRSASASQQQVQSEISGKPALEYGVLYLEYRDQTVDIKKNTINRDQASKTQK